MKKTYLDLSAGHLTPETREALINTSVQGRMASGWPALSIGEYEYGWFVTVPPLDIPGVGAQMHNLPRDLRECLFYAFQQGAELIRFDADGDECGDITFYQEI